jgi:hypothetical protein
LRSGSKKLGMSEYTNRFVENRIDISALPDLTDQPSRTLVSRAGTG